jgi:hypothetical protein
MVQPERFQRGRHRREEGGIHRRRRSVGDGPKATRQREGCHEVVDREKLGLLALEPRAGGMVLTLRTAAVATGAHPCLAVATVRTNHGRGAEGAGSAIGDRAQGVALVCRQVTAVAPDQGRHADANEIGETHRGGCHEASCGCASRRIAVPS